MPPPKEGTLSFHDTMSDAVDGAAWIQESVPERLELKRKVYQTLQSHCDEGAIIGSSTSGFKPSELKDCATRPDQIVVCHPFNPVYLLPLVEVVGAGDRAAQVSEILKDIGMQPLPSVLQRFRCIRLRLHTRMTLPKTMSGLSSQPP